MIYESTKDYSSGRVILVYDGADPSIEEIHSYCQRNYGFIPSSVVVNDQADADTDWSIMGIEEPGIIYCYPSTKQFGVDE